MLQGRDLYFRKFSKLLCYLIYTNLFLNKSSFVLIAQTLMHRYFWSNIREIIISLQYNIPRGSGRLIPPTVRTQGREKVLQAFLTDQLP